MMFPDEVQITPITIDQYRKEAPDVAFNIEAYVEESGEVKYSSSGQPIDPEIWVFLPGDTEIKKGDFIEIIKLHGQDPTTQEAGKKKVKRVHRAGAFSISHIEVLV